MEPQALPVLEERLLALLDEKPGEPLRTLLADSDPVELASVLYRLALEQQRMLLELMPAPQAAEVLIELEDSALQQLSALMAPERFAAFVALMEPDDAADVIGTLEPHLSAAVLQALPSDRRGEVGLLLTYGAETAGGLMDPDVVQVRASQTVAEAVEEIRSYVERVRLDDFFSVFVVDDRRRLVGVVPNWKLLLAEGDRRIEEIMIPDPISVDVQMDQEEVSNLVRDHDLVTVPVVNPQRQLIGRITIDDVVDVIQEEHHEDLGRLTGTGSEAVRETSIAQTLRVRAPWLFIALGGEFASAIVMHSHEGFLVTIPQLAFFIPVIMAMGGNTGVQSASLVIRGLATGEVRLSHFWRRLSREVLVALCMGLVFASILVLGSALLTGRMRLGLAVGLATLTTISLSSTAGIAIPMVLRRLELDPALATGPFLTTLNDVMGIVVYLLVASLILF